MPYIPNKDAEVVQWGRNYSDLLTDDPPRYGLSAADALIVQTQFDIFNASYERATDPSTRTIVTVADKDGEKLTFLQLARQYAAIIRANAGVSDEDKTALGLHIPDPTPTPIPPPTTYPTVSILLLGSGEMQLFIADQLTPDIKAKPAGVAGCLLFRKFAATRPTDMVGALLHRVITRADTVLDTSDVPPGNFIAFQGQWFNKKGQIGPIGPVVSFAAP
jgi:hypothetical protein